jgi:hypothetical protein
MARLTEENEEEQEEGNEEEEQEESEEGGDLCLDADSPWYGMSMEMIEEVFDQID